VAKTCRSAFAQFVGRHKGHSQSGLSNRFHISHPGSISPLTAEEVRRRLIDDKGYPPDILPKQRTILNQMNQLGFKLTKVVKSKPKKKYRRQTPFFNMYIMSIEPLMNPKELRISIDTKANVNIGSFRETVTADAVLKNVIMILPPICAKPFGIHLPALDENYIYFINGNVMADFMVDALEDLWSSLKLRLNPHTIVINADNGPENGSRRSQFM
jgi:hypothetical protein